MKVFVVQEGVWNEGYLVIKVFSTHEKALTYVNDNYRKPSWLQKDKDWWDFGCRFVEIAEYEVE